MKVNKPHSFDTFGDAFEWLHKKVDDPCIDNDRMYFLGDAVAEKVFLDQSENGCCGALEVDVIIAGKKARIGCNYGH